MGKNQIRHDEAAKSIPYLGDLLQHPLIPIVEDFMAECEIPSLEYRTVEVDSIQYLFIVKPGFSQYIQVYRVPGGEVYVRLEIGICNLPKGQEDKVCDFLLKRNYELFCPFRYSLAEQDQVVVQYRCYNLGQTESGFVLRLNSIVSFAFRLYEELQAKFGATPLISSEPLAVAKRMLH